MRRSGLDWAGQQLLTTCRIVPFPLPWAPTSMPDCILRSPNSFEHSILRSSPSLAVLPIFPTVPCNCPTWESIIFTSGLHSSAVVTLGQRMKPLCSQQGPMMQSISPGGQQPQPFELECAMSHMQASHFIPSQALMIATERRWNQRWGCLFALDITYNQSLRALSSEPLATNERIQLASGIGNQWHFGRAHLALLHGWVWTNPDHILGRRHLHTALAYEINEHISFEMGLRSFSLRADYSFLGIRCRL